MLLLQVDVGGVATTDFLTDLGRLTSSFYLNSASLKSIFVITNRKYCGETGFLSDGGECHVCEGHGRTGFRCSHWDHIPTLRPAKEFHQHQVHLHVGSRKWVGKIYIHIFRNNWTKTRACMMWFVMQRSDPGYRAGCPLPILCIRELHPEAESWGQHDWICTFTQWRLLQGYQSAGSVVRSSF